MRLQACGQGYLNGLWLPAPLALENSTYVRTLVISLIYQRYTIFSTTVKHSSLECFSIWALADEFIYY